MTYELSLSWVLASALATAPIVGGLDPGAPAPGTFAPVVGIGVQPAGGDTEVLILVDGTPQVSDYLLHDPHRLVVDLTGARHALPGERFPGIDRGGVRSVRTSQFSPEVVRVVIDLSAEVDYRVSRDSGAIRLRFPNPGGPFDAWSAAAVAPRVGDARGAQVVEPPPAGAAPAADAAPQERRQQPSITVAFEDMDIRDVLATFADFSGRSIVAGDGVTGTVNATIQGQPWDVALYEILRSHGLLAEETESGIIRVEPLRTLKERQAVEPLVTRQFRIQYISVDSIVQRAVEGILSDSGKVTISPATNTLLVTDRQSVLDRLEPIIRELDVRTPQVTIAARIIFVDRTALEELGVVYDIKDSRGNQLNRVFPGFLDSDGDGIEADDATNDDVVLLGGASIAALANANARVTRPALQLLTSLILGRHTLVSFLEALQQLSLTDIQAVPTITVLDHRSARVQVGEETPVRVLDEGSAGTQGGPRATVNFRQTGIILEVTPHVVADQVLMEIHAERSNIALAPSDIGVTFQTQEADTEILLNDGETAVISGLTLTERTSVRTGIPLLMDLPLIGGLFRTTQERENKRDLLIMVTPHIDKKGAE